MKDFTDRMDELLSLLHSVEEISADMPKCLYDVFNVLEYMKNESNRDVCEFNPVDKPADVQYDDYKKIIRQSYDKKNLHMLFFYACFFHGVCNYLWENTTAFNGIEPKVISELEAYIDRKIKNLAELKSNINEK